MDFNFLGVCFIDDDLSKRTHDKVYNKTEELQEQIREQFDNWIEEQGLENVMGVIDKKGSIKR